MMEGVEIISMFDANEHLVVIDEDNGPQQGGKGNVVCTLGRSFEGEKHLNLLFRALDRGKAQDWHAKERIGLHTFQDMAAVLKTLGKCRSRCFALRFVEREIVIQERGDSLSRFTGRISPEHQKFWPLSNSHSRHILLTIIRILQNYGRGKWCFQKPNKINFIVDRLPYIKEIDPSELKDGMLEILLLGYNGIEVRAFTIENKEVAPIPVLQYLGLVDSEVWLFGRLCRTTLENGKTIDQQISQFRSMTDLEQDAFEFCAPSLNFWEEGSFQSGNKKKLANALKSYHRFWLRQLAENRFCLNGTYQGDLESAKQKTFKNKWALQ